MIGLIVDYFILSIKAPKRAKATRVADPMANPFPIAAVVLPAASKTSVLDQIFSPSSAISAIPPALSEIGPNPSIVRPILRVDNIPTAAKDIPRRPKRLIEIKIVIEIIITGIIVD